MSERDQEPTERSRETGRRLKRARQTAGWTQEELGRRAGVSGSTIAAYEQGRRHQLPTMEKIARELQIPVTNLLAMPGDEVDDVDLDTIQAQMRPWLARLSAEAREQALRMIKLMAG